MHSDSDISVVVSVMFGLRNEESIGQMIDLTRGNNTTTVSKVQLVYAANRCRLDAQQLFTNSEIIRSRDFSVVWLSYNKDSISNLVATRMILIIRSCTFGPNVVSTAR